MTKSEEKRRRRSFTAEFKADAVRLTKTGERSIGQVAKDLGVGAQSLREWIKRSDESGAGPSESLSKDEPNLYAMA